MKSKQPKISIGFIIFRPEKSFYDRLEIITQAGIPFYVYDNSPDIIDAKLTIEPLLNARYLSSGKNEGLGVGLYDLCQSAYQDDFEGLLFFDQDTEFNLETIFFIHNFMNENITNLFDNYSAVTICTCRVSYIHPF